MRKKTAAIVGLVALVLLQVSSAAHQFDHTIYESAEACELCVQLDRSGDAPVASVASINILPSHSTIIAVPSWTATVETASHHSIRSPPNA